MFRKSVDIISATSSLNSELVSARENKAISPQHYFLGLLQASPVGFSISIETEPNGSAVSGKASLGLASVKSVHTKS